MIIMMQRFGVSGIAIFLLLASCATPGRFVVTNLGYEPAEYTESTIYALPKTGLKVDVNYQKDVFIPGPYADYALRLLGIAGVKKNREESYRLGEVKIETNTEPDGKAFYSLTSQNGKINYELINWALTNNLILAGNFLSDTDIDVQKIQDGTNGIQFKNVTMESNVEMKEQTIYKTVITDTSFVRVPVTSQQIERKTLEKKAEEAAKLILEIRSDRYYLAAGIVDPMPDNFNLQAAFNELDKLEEEYLSLFVGKSFTEYLRKGYYIIPEGSVEKEHIVLDHFSDERGLASGEGESVELVIEPAGNAKSFRNLLPQGPEAEVYNHFYYRIPEVCDIKVVHGNRLLFNKRISIYQAGALVNVKTASGIVTQ